jgi:ASC-1-like (ASCH) protein
VPLFLTIKEVFIWIKKGEKTIDVRKGNPKHGDIAVIQSGPTACLRMHILKKETGRLREVIREDNYRQIIPTAKNLQEALNYLQRFYGSEEGIFTAYYLGQQKQQ